MPTTRQVRDYLRLRYPVSVSKSTQAKRKQNILAFYNLVQNSIQRIPTLHYGNQERRTLLYSTICGERVFIQYPGKESTNAGDKNRPLDFRPKIELSDGHILRDLTFFDIWSIVEKIGTGHQNVLDILNSIFFRMGRMIDYVEVNDNCQSWLLTDNETTIVPDCADNLIWNKLTLQPDIVETMNNDFDGIIVDEQYELSFEAFLYFFELLLQNEECKYHFPNSDLKSGRITTTDSNILIASYFMGRTTLADLLMRFQAGRGVANCSQTEYPLFTNNMVELTNVKTAIKDFLDREGIAYRSSTSLTRVNMRVPMPLKISSKKMAFFDVQPPSDQLELLNSLGWRSYCFDDLLVEDTYNQVLVEIMRP